MAMRFIGKKPQNKYIRPVCNSRIKRYVVPASEPAVAEVGAETSNTNNEDMADKRITQIAQVVSPEKPSSKRRNTRVEKKADGLYEHAQDAVTILTEDNKMLLND